MLTKISITDVNKLISHTNIDFKYLEETSYGITDTTYIGTSKAGEKYVLKIFENLSCEEVENRLFMLNELSELPIPKVVSKEIQLYKNKPALLFFLHKRGEFK